MGLIEREVERARLDAARDENATEESVYDAASRVRMFLDTRAVMGGLDPERIAQAGSYVSHHETVDLLTSDLRVLVAAVLAADASRTEQPEDIPR
jgi:hypothetical protein